MHILLGLALGFFDIICAVGIFGIYGLCFLSFFAHLQWVWFLSVLLAFAGFIGLGVLGLFFRKFSEGGLPLLACSGVFAYLAFCFLKKRWSAPFRNGHLPSGNRMARNELRERLRSFYVPAIHFRRSKKETFSQIGGQPMLPPEMTWPAINNQVLAFLAQIDLKEVNAKMKSFLPKSGVLYFFCRENEDAKEYKDALSWQVIYWDGKCSSLRKRFAPAGVSSEYSFNRKFIHAERTRVLPHVRELYDKKLVRDVGNELDLLGELYDESYGIHPFNERISRGWYSNVAELSENYPAHQMFGYPCAVQNPNMALECEAALLGIDIYSLEENDPCFESLKKGASDWRLLFQLASDNDTNMMWGDKGMLYFWIREKDALRKDFSKVHLIMQCH